MKVDDMKALGAADRFCVSAALGWLELGNSVEAHLQLDEINPEFRLHPLVLRLRWCIHASTRQWECALRIAENMLLSWPRDFSGWVMESESLRGLGCYYEAFEALLPAAILFPQDPTIGYLLACYAARTGRSDLARKWLAKALDLDGSSEFKLKILGDPDLALLWQTAPTCQKS